MWKFKKQILFFFIKKNPCNSTGISSELPNMWEKENKTWNAGYPLRHLLLPLYQILKFIKNSNEYSKHSVIKVYITLWDKGLDQLNFFLTEGKWIIEEKCKYKEWLCDRLQTWELCLLWIFFLYLLYICLYTFTVLSSFFSPSPSPLSLLTLYKECCWCVIL